MRIFPLEPSNAKQSPGKLFGCINKFLSEYELNHKKPIILNSIGFAYGYVSGVDRIEPPPDFSA